MKTVQVKEAVAVGTFVRFDYDKKKKTAAVWQEERSLGVIAIAFEQESLFIGDEMLGVSVSSDADHAEIALIPMTEAVEQPMVYLEVSLEVKTLLDVTYADDTLTFSLEGEILAQVPAGDHAKLFKYRNHLKGWVHIGLEGQAVVQLIRFVDPHRHSGMSFLDGMTKIETLVEKTPFAGALTDHGVLHGTLHYYQQMKKRGKMPIIGFEAYSESINGEKEKYHLLLIAKDEVGYQNLVKLSSLAQENIYYKPQVSYSMLMEHAEGVIATTGCLGSEVNQLLINKDIHGARTVIETMIEIFGKENYFVEIQRHGSEEEITVNPILEKFAREFDLRMVASTDAHYPNVEDRDDHELLLCIGTKRVYSDSERMKFNGTGFHIHTDEEMETLFADLPSALDGTLELLEMCKDFHIPIGVNHLPHFPVPDGFTEEMTYLRHLAEEGFQNRFAGTDQLTDPEYVERFTFELDTLEFMGFPGYFLIVQDFIRWAKARGIAVGPGRGSAAGSLVAYCLDITDLDPIPFGLLFERFLNPDRISMPDIDIDFPDDRREEVMEYVKEKYGEESFSKITTFQTLGVKSALKDVARVLEVDDSLINRLTKMVPNRPKITFEEVMEESPDFVKMVNGSKILQRVVKTATKIQGLPRNPSVHACARIITPGEVTDHVPVVMAMNAKTKERELASQYSMDEVEAVGLLKMDFLGLRTMTVIANATDLVNEQRAKEGLPPMHYLNIPLGDPKVYQAISEGESYGVFQLESAGMRTFMKDLFADAYKFNENSIELFERLVAGVSLYRPGPMDYIPEYIENMNDPSKIRYDHPKLEPILKGTYGVIVYQEQTMLLVRELAGFTKGEADNVRKAFAKKKQEMIAPLKDKFLKGCEQNGVDLRVAEAIWLKMEKFGSYAFNKSHAAVYSMLSNATAWFKTYHPEIFMAATLNSFLKKRDKLKLYMTIAKRMGIEVLPPDVNRSRDTFAVEDGKIRFGLRGLRGMGAMAARLVAEREENGLFRDPQELVERMVIGYGFSEEHIRSLIRSGGMDAFGHTRQALATVVPDWKKLAGSLKKTKVNKDQMSMFDLMAAEEADAFRHLIPVPDMEEMDHRTLLEFENDTAGLYISGHPLDDYVLQLRQEKVDDIGFILEETGAFDEEEDMEMDDEYVHVKVTSDMDGKLVKIAGIINSVETFFTKKDGLPIKKIYLEDRTGGIECVAFSDTIASNEGLFMEKLLVQVEGRIKIDDFGVSINIRSITLLDEKKPTATKVVELRTENKKVARDFLEYVKANPGPIETHVTMDGKTFRLPASLHPSKQAALFDIYGEAITLHM